MTHTHTCTLTHTHTHSLTHSHTHTHTLSLSLALALSFPPRQDAAVPRGLHSTKNAPPVPAWLQAVVDAPSDRVALAAAAAAVARDDTDGTTAEAQLIDRCIAAACRREAPAGGGGAEGDSDCCVEMATAMCSCLQESTTARSLTLKLLTHKLRAPQVVCRACVFVFVFVFVPGPGPCAVCLLLAVELLFSSRLSYTTTHANAFRTKTAKFGQKDVGLSFGSA